MCKHAQTLLVRVLQHACMWLRSMHVLQPSHVLSQLCMPARPLHRLRLSDSLLGFP
jgi:hypothetical protein